MNQFQKLRDSWQTDSIRLAPPAAADEVAAFEGRHGVELPADFKDYLTAAGGMQEGETDEHLISFAVLPALDDASRWPLLDESRRGLIFADFSLFAHYYLLDVGTGAVFAADGEVSQQLAATFREFIERYLEDPAGIAHCLPADASTK